MNYHLPFFVAFGRLVCICMRICAHTQYLHAHTLTTHLQGMGGCICRCNIWPTGSARKCNWREKIKKKQASALELVIFCRSGGKIERRGKRMAGKMREGEEWREEKLRDEVALSTVIRDKTSALELVISGRIGGKEREGEKEWREEKLRGRNCA